MRIDGSLTPAGETYLRLKENWTTRRKGQTDPQGAFAFSGVLGEYEVTVTTGGQEQTFVLDLGGSASRSVTLTIEGVAGVTAPAIVMAGVPRYLGESRDYETLFNALAEAGVIAFFPTFQYQEIPAPGRGETLNFSRYADNFGFDVYPIPMSAANLTAPYQNGAMTDYAATLENYARWLAENGGEKPTLLVFPTAVSSTMVAKSWRPQKLNYKR